MMSGQDRSSFSSNPSRAESPMTEADLRTVTIGEPSRGSEIVISKYDPDWPSPLKGRSADS